MRVELRVEKDEHEFEISLTSDGSNSITQLIMLAGDAMHNLLKGDR